MYRKNAKYNVFAEILHLLYSIFYFLSSSQTLTKLFIICIFYELQKKVGNVYPWSLGQVHGAPKKLYNNHQKRHKWFTLDSQKYTRIQQRFSFGHKNIKYIIRSTHVLYTVNGRGTDLSFFCISATVRINLQHSQAHPYGIFTRVTYLTQAYLYVEHHTEKQLVPYLL